MCVCVCVRICRCVRLCATVLVRLRMCRLVSSVGWQLFAAQPLPSQSVSQRVATRRRALMPAAKRGLRSLGSKAASVASSKRSKKSEKTAAPPASAASDAGGESTSRRRVRAKELPEGLCRCRRCGKSSEVVSGDMCSQAPTAMLLPTMRSWVQRQAKRQKSEQLGEHSKFGAKL